MKCLIFLAALFAVALSAPRLRSPFVPAKYMNGVPFIIGGEDATPGKWKWQASLENFGSHSCGGSLVAKNYVLTAAHCVQGASLFYSVVLGKNNDNMEGQTIDVNRVISHPKFRQDASQGFPNDIALLELSENADLSDPNIEIGTIAPKGADYTGKVCTITGWGATIGGGSVSRILKQADVTALSSSECRNRFGLLGSIITDKHLCVTDKENQDKGACNGDSGGPANCPSGDGYHISGVTSFGIRNCPTTFPSVYTKVAEYNDFILEVINGTYKEA